MTHFPWYKGRDNRYQRADNSKWLHSFYKKKQEFQEYPLTKVKLRLVAVTISNIEY